MNVASIIHEYYIGTLIVVLLDKLPTPSNSNSPTGSCVRATLGTLLLRGLGVEGVIMGAEENISTCF